MEKFFNQIDDIMFYSDPLQIFQILPETYVTENMRCTMLTKLFKCKLSLVATIVSPITPSEEEKKLIYKCFKTGICNFEKSPRQGSA